MNRLLPPGSRWPADGGDAPSDQADGLRRLFAGRGQRLLALVANAHVPEATAVLERVTSGLLALGRQVLVVDAALTSPPPSELARLDLAAGVEMLRPDLSYLPARGLPLAHVDTRGCEASFLDALERIAPDADCVLLHAEATDMARMLGQRSVRPLLLGADDPQSIFAAYAACKLIAQRCALMSYDLLLVADPAAQRLPSIATSLARCADGFLGAVLHDWTVIDPALENGRTDEEALERLLAAQLSLESESLPRPLAGWPAAALSPDSAQDHAL